jgi:AcrR family transcriptional regulator
MTGRPSARDRLLAAADELFYAEGVHTVGIDRINERAGVAKASLYNTFGSREALVGAYLDGRHHGTAGRLTRAVERHTDPRERLLAVFDAQGELLAEPGSRGCPFAAAGADARPGSAAERAAGDYRAWLLELFTGLAADAGAADPAALARQLRLVFDGAGLAARMDRDPAVAASARAAAAALLEAHSGDDGVHGQ